MIDTHAHIYDEAFNADRDEVLTRARVAGINKVFLPNINAATVEPMLDLCRQNPDFCHPMLGLHPEDVRHDWSCVLDEMEARLQQTQHPFIAIGEIGLDFYWDQTYREQQMQAFARQVSWAFTYNLPLMIHTRSAHCELMDVLKEELSNRELSTCPIRGVFHCFGGTVEEARELLAYDGFMIGIGGVVTFKKSSLHDVLRAEIPLERVVLETDSPYLAPVPYRGKRNESAHLQHVVERLADIYQCSVVKVTQITTQNALKTFPKAA